MPQRDIAVRRVLGWREWVALPQLGIRDVKAKVDTGAKTSALHVMDLDVRNVDGVDVAHFRVHPDVEGRPPVDVQVPVAQWRVIKDSGGHATNRPIIRTLCQVGDWEKPIDVSLSGRVEMGFRMLLGREALRGGFVVDPSLSYVARERFATHSLVPWKGPRGPPGEEA